MPASAPNEPAEGIREEAVSQLNEGLKVCQRVVTDYRAALSRNQPADRDEDSGPDRQD